jgi:hypothetical protein
VLTWPLAMPPLLLTTTRAAASNRSLPSQLCRRWLHRLLLPLQPPLSPWLSSGRVAASSCSWLC